MLLHLSQFSPFCPTSTQNPPLPQAILIPLFKSMGPVYMFSVYSISYTVHCNLHTHGYSVTIYLYF